MKRGRGRGKERRMKSWVVKPQKGDKEVDELGGGCITDLPKDISINILLRLSVKELLTCRCSSKTWRNIITSDPEFAKLYFARAEICPLIQPLAPKYVSRTLYLLEPPPDSSSGYLECDNGLVNMKLDAKLNIPLRNAELLAINNEEGVATGKPCINLRPKDHKLNVVNSYNGLLCLSEPNWGDPIAVCNPITGEYINLPVSTPCAPKRCWGRTKKFIDCGLGYSPKSKQYKVIRMFDQKINEWTMDANIRPVASTKRMAEIHTLGTGSWKMIGDVPFSTNNINMALFPNPDESRWKLVFPTYLNGALHWLCVDSWISDFIVSFNFDNEQFQLIPPPPLPPPLSLLVDTEIIFREKRYMSCGVLRGCLCICDASSLKDIRVWVMKEYGVQRSWTQEFRIDTRPDMERLRCGLYAPINYLSNGAIVLFHSLSSSLFYYDPKGPTYKYLLVSRLKSKFGAIAHVPSFISLKDTVMGDNLEGVECQIKVCKV